MSTIFTKIINGEIPCYKVYENTNVYAFLDIHPKQLGHVLVVPKKPVDSFFELPNTYYESVFIAAKRIAEALKVVTKSKKIGIIVEGLEVDHAHLHLIPINKSGDLHATSKPFSQKEMEEIQQQIVKKLG
jgi:histidine triad (HIT) family protein